MTQGTPPPATPRDANRVVVTTSWDDGHALDLKLAEMLARYRIPATFYIAPRSIELAPEDCLTAAQIAEISGGFEIGGHTLHHLRLPSISLRAAEDEIRSGKEELEGIIGAPLRSFCYPGGRYRRAHVELVSRAGFRMARTVRRGVTGHPDKPLEVGTTVHAYRHLKDPLVGLRSGLRPQRFLDLFWNWDELAIAMFDEVAASGGVFHLWGHSWEVDARGDWDRLERVLTHIGGREDATYVTNSGLVSDTVVR
jgi:peptidoglycan/xylan/chitin deacetylase (PgdA/CDA1 family)